MYFSEEFFRPEVRDGFFVNGTMKRAWAAQLEVLKVISDICAKYDIPWFAEAGTLLGAVRHKGFIPWDDDMDISMLREDYNLFQKIIERELPQGYRLLTYKNREESMKFWDVFIRVVNTDKIRVDEEFLKEFHQFPYPAGVDIFPLEYVPRDPEQEKEWLALSTITRAAVLRGEKMDDPNDEESVHLLQVLENATGHHFHNQSSLQEQIYYLNEAINSIYHSEEADELISPPLFIQKGNYRFKKSWFEKVKLLSFEHLMIPVPYEFEEVLKAEFGEQYMVPLRVAEYHEYPYFENLEKLVVEQKGDIFNLHFDENLIKELSCRKSNQEQTKGLIIVLLTHFDQWKSVEPYCEKKKKEGFEVRISATPYLISGFLRNALDVKIEGEESAGGLSFEVYNYEQLKELNPAEIVITNPFDQYGETEIVDPSFFTTELKKITSKLIYISPYDLDEEADDDLFKKSLVHLVMSPGVMNADEVYVQSQSMKDKYLEILNLAFERDAEKEPNIRELISEDELNKLFSNKIKYVK